MFERNQTMKSLWVNPLITPITSEQDIKHLRVNMSWIQLFQNLDCYNNQTAWMKSKQWEIPLSKWSNNFIAIAGKLDNSHWSVSKLRLLQKPKCMKKKENNLWIHSSKLAKIHCFKIWKPEGKSNKLCVSGQKFKHFWLWLGEGHSKAHPPPMHPFSAATAYIYEK